MCCVHYRIIYNCDISRVHSICFRAGNVIPWYRYISPTSAHSHPISSVTTYDTFTKGHFINSLWAYNRNFVKIIFLCFQSHDAITSFCQPLTGHSFYIWSTMTKLDISVVFLCSWEGVYPTSVVNCVFFHFRLLLLLIEPINQLRLW